MDLDNFKGTPRVLTHVGCTEHDLSHVGYNPM